MTLRTLWCKGKTSSCLWSSDCHTHKFCVAKYFASPKKVLCCGLDSNFQWLWSVVSFNYKDAIVTTITTKLLGLFLWEYEEVKLENSIFKYFYTYLEANLKSFIGPNKWFSSSPRYNTGKQRYGNAPGGRLGTRAVGDVYLVFLICMYLW